MSRSLRAETRSRNSDIKRGTVRSDLKVRKWEKKWVTIGDTTMKIFKWVPISNSEKKKIIHHQTSKSDKENVQQKETTQLSSNFGTEDSNTCFSMVSDSQGATDFVSSMPFSEDSNSQGSEGPKNV